MTNYLNNWDDKVTVLNCLSNGMSVDETCTQTGLSKGIIYNYRNEFAKVYFCTENDKDFPRRLLGYYTKRSKKTLKVDLPILYNRIHEVLA